VGWRLIEYRQECLSTTKDDCIPLINQHWDEIALNKQSIKLNPDWDEYERLSKNGSLRIFTARDGGELVGYFVLIVNRSLHYKDHLFAVNDILFMRQDHRKGSTALKLLRFAEKALRNDGVSLVMVNTKVHQPFDPLMERLGYNLIERIYSKNLIEV
jgi:GNAT superfamily N-acetyltransferase